jgi:hypothetical protein
MKIFISWSGDRSRQVAELLDDWIQCVIQAVDPWMSSKDIDRGALWFTEISDELANTSVGIVCLTKENKNKPWILFESGALAKGLSSNRVCTFLIDLEPIDLENPLAQFNHTSPNRAGLFQLVRTINLSLTASALKEQVLEKVFDTYWPQFEEKFTSILKNTSEVTIKDKRKGDEILLEVLSTVRGMDRRLREVETQKVSEQNADISRPRPSGVPVSALIRHYQKNGFDAPKIYEKLMDRGYSEKEAKMYLNKYYIDISDSKV